MILKVERMNHTGDGIATQDKKVYFIPKSVKGDIVEIKKNDINIHKNYIQVTNYQLKTPSKKRVSIQCPYYQKCGGCQLLGISYEEQLIYKNEKVIDIIKKYANEQIKPEIIGTKQYEYRNKITLQVQNGKLGLYSENTNTLINIKKCLLIPKNLNETLPILSDLNLSKVTKIILKTIKSEIMIQFLGNINKNEVVKKLEDKVQSIWINNNLIYGNPYLKEILLPYQFYISPNSFFQVNNEGTIAIYEKVKDYLGKNNNHVLDLYCGTGTIGIYISNCCKKVTGIELNDSSVEDAKKNIKLNNITNMNIQKGDVGTLLEEKEKYDAIIVDPPRSGLNKKAVNKLLNIKSKKIIYISCNPITLARDINILKASYNLEKISLVDMFPNTYHVECICLLTLNT